MENIGELAREGLLPRVPFRTLPAIAGAKDMVNVAASALSSLTSVFTEWRPFARRSKMPVINGAVSGSGMIVRLPAPPSTFLYPTVA